MPKTNAFLYSFFKEEKYLQNYPLETKNFISFCKQRGLEISEKELEFLEKEKLFFPIFRIRLPKLIEKNGKRVWERGNYKIKLGEKFIRYSPFIWMEGVEEDCLRWLKSGILFAPSQKRFQSWKNFKAGRKEQCNQKIISFYSSFQIDWLTEIIKFYPPKFSALDQTIEAKNVHLIKRSNKIYLKTNLEKQLDDKPYQLLPGDKLFKYLEHKKLYEDSFKQEFSWKIAKQRLLKCKQIFDKKLYFLLDIQGVYYPYGKLGGKKINVVGGLEKWGRKKYRFNLRKELSSLKLSINDIVRWYKEFSDKTHLYLGVERDDWVQLWKSIDWNEKDNLQGNVRLGIDCLQWAIMLKRFVQDHEKKEILDVDEVRNVLDKDILQFDLNDTKLNNLRSIRNRWYYDLEKDKNYYHDNLKRLFYLVNDFGIDYQPRVMVFVEGKIEEEILQKHWKDWYGISAENLGIEFVDFGGVDKILSTAETVKKLRNLTTKLDQEYRIVHLKKQEKIELNNLIRILEETDIVISNFQSLINYNLEKWQILPFFVADNEGNIKKTLESGKIIKFEEQSYDVPEEWKFIWGISNKHKPFKGKDFEFANFSDKEIRKAIKQCVHENIFLKRIKEVRGMEKGIKEIGPEVKRYKFQIVEKLFSNLFEEYGKSKDESFIAKRPVSELVEKITKLGVLNHLPINTKIELENKEFIKKQLNAKYKRIKFIR